jgi:DNA-binding transcriptional MerR regulator
VSPRELVTLGQAAQRTGRPRETLRNWVRRSLLFPVGLEHDDTELYDLADIRRLCTQIPRRRRSRRKASDAD